jgi:hypothetical protein
MGAALRSFAPSSRTSPAAPSRRSRPAPATRSRCRTSRRALGVHPRGVGRNVGGGGGLRHPLARLPRQHARHPLRVRQALGRQGAAVPAGRDLPAALPDGRADRRGVGHGDQQRRPEPPRVLRQPAGRRSAAALVGRGVEPRIVDMVGIFVNPTAGAAGDWGAPALNADDDRLIANTDYAILGATSQIAARRSLHRAETSGRKIGMPLLTQEQGSGQWFVELSQRYTCRSSRSSTPTTRATSCSRPRTPPGRPCRT